MTAAVLQDWANRCTDRPIRTIATAYHVEYFDRGYWHTESEHVCEAHAKHREQRFMANDFGRDFSPTRVVKVTTAAERTVIE